MLSFGVGIVVALAVALCVAALILLVLMRWRSRSQQAQSSGGINAAVKSTELQQQEMEWDNSTFNITVNPLDRESGFDEDCDLEAGGLPPPAGDEDELACSADELDVEAAVPVDKPGCKELEWDDSTLSY